jgi:uncharacterized protein YxjI
MKYYVKQKIFSLKDQFYIMDQSGKEVYGVKGKMFSLSNKMELLNMNGSQVLSTNKKILAFLAKYFVYDPHGELLAEIKRKFGIRPRFQIIMGNQVYSVEGSLFAHSFGIFDGSNEVASISKKVLSFGDTYEIDIHDDTKTELFLFIVIILDQILHENKNDSKFTNL